MDSLIFMFGCVGPMRLGRASMGYTQALLRSRNKRLDTGRKRRETDAYPRIVAGVAPRLHPRVRSKPATALRPATPAAVTALHLTAHAVIGPTLSFWKVRRDTCSASSVHKDRTCRVGTHPERITGTTTAATKHAATATPQASIAHLFPAHQPPSPHPETPALTGFPPISSYGRTAHGERLQVTKCWFSKELRTRFKSETTEPRG